MKEISKIRRLLGSRDGLTLIEVAVAMFCFGIAISGMCLLTIATKESNDLARDHYVAVNLAKNRLERSHSYGFDQLGLFAESDVIVDESGRPDPNGHYRRSTIVSNVTPLLYHVEVNIEILNRVSLEFDPGAEGVQTLVTDLE